MFWSLWIALGWLVCLSAVLHHGGITRDQPGQPRLSDWLICGAIIETLAIAGMILEVTLKTLT